jgi:hypothetical protein
MYGMILFGPLEGFKRGHASLAGWSRLVYVGGQQTDIDRWQVCSIKKRKRKKKLKGRSREQLAAG